ncbi:hypothetical protein L1987_18504 [Smallanthus sonchifolius]|uniref:Uncharacterized protein n=1 Tax=Smallanthus sonchifolius TaxID=185202 RepID=A0ACB9J2H8_9ASTR|nr:hypothetical protein L1987_18504 [Smallanthus sonchifolius]
MNDGLFTCFISKVEPKNIKAALLENSWVEAMQEELQQFTQLQVWNLVDLPKNKVPIGIHWIFRNKKDERGIVVRNKARLVVQGFYQEEGIDFEDVFAPVARLEAIGMFLAYAVYMDFTVYQMDVKSAFLYGKVQEEVYVKQPPVFIDPIYPDRVYKLDKALYDLHQEHGELLTKLYLNKRMFEMSSMGEMKFFLGLQVDQSKSGILIHHEKYVKEILTKFKMTESHPYKMPAEVRHSLSPDLHGGASDLRDRRRFPEFGLTVLAFAAREGPGNISRDTRESKKSQNPRFRLFKDLSGHSLRRDRLSGCRVYFGNLLLALRLSRIVSEYRTVETERTVSDYAKSTDGGVRSSITQPTVESNSWHFPSHVMSTIATNVQFHGNSHENPHSHLTRFCRVCDTFRLNGVTKDAKLLRLFPFSLADKAATWLESLPNGSITTWASARGEFLAKYYPPSKAAHHRSLIPTFEQQLGEGFHDAWDIFKGLCNDYPHHGIEDWCLVEKFYNGYSIASRGQLETAIGGT